MPDGGCIEITYVDGAPNGPWKRLLANGTVNRECHLVDGQWDGEMTVRDSIGRILDRAIFVRGTGTYRIFTCDGQLGWEIPLQDGKRHGVVRRLSNGRYLEERWHQGTRLT